MKELSIEKMETVTGGCGMDDMLFYSGMHLYYLGKQDYMAAGAYLARMFGCM
ncbi:bacteriocin-like protein [Algoriphagus antarcticus]|uniref:Bacteriocin-like protein n=1 Tax=Algoriphagus antarcticus TaxID=238540 RepID=A0A3E0DQV9_9BACT|nr:bacteriocin-like protein [Algoriphagus antarcticus]